MRFGHGVKLITATHPVGPPLKRRGEADTSRPIIIEDGVWLCADARVQPGVRVARGCIIATGAVIVRDTSPDGFYAGNPATRIADIADDGTIIMKRERRERRSVAPSLQVVPSVSHVPSYLKDESLNALPDTGTVSVDYNYFRERRARTR